MKQAEKVLVTGATGFLGSHIVRTLLLKGYSVKASVHDLSCTEKLEVLKTLPSQDRLEIVEADLLKPETWPNAVKNCDYVIHTASPVSLENPKDEDLMIKPILGGTLSIIKECQNNPRIKAVIITSSASSIVPFGKDWEKSKVLTESDWGSISNNTAYGKAKILMEKAVLGMTTKFRIVILNPVFMFGPALIKHDFASGGLIKGLLTGEVKAIPKLHLAIVDVRDAVAAHVAAMENPGIDHKRYICYAGGMWMHEAAEILRAEFGKYGYPIPTAVLEECPIKDPTQQLAKMWGKEFVYSSQALKQDLGLAELIPPKEAVLTMAHSFIENGVVPDLISKKP